MTEVSKQESSVGSREVEGNNGMLGTVGLDYGSTLLRYVFVK